MTRARTRRRWPAVLVGAAVLLLLAAHTATWLVACNGLERGAAEAVRQARAEGWNVSAGPPRRSGWPLAAEVVFPDLVVAGGPETFPPGLVWQAQTLRLSLALSAPTTLVLEPGGRATFEAAGLPALAFESRHFTVKVPLASAAPPTANVRSLTVILDGKATTVREAVASFPRDGVDAELNGIALPSITPELQTLRAQAVLTRPVPPAATPADRARAWRDAGGSVDLTTVSVRWGKLDATGHGVIALDEQLQPRADGEIEASGIAPALDDLAHTGALPTSAATAAKAVIAILAAPAPGAPVRLPVTLRSGVLALARFPLLRLPPLEWD